MKDRDFTITIDKETLQRIAEAWEMNYENMTDNDLAEMVNETIDNLFSSEGYYGDMF